MDGIARTTKNKGIINVNIWLKEYLKNFYQQKFFLLYEIIENKKLIIIYSTYQSYFYKNRFLDLLMNFSCIPTEFYKLTRLGQYKKKSLSVAKFSGKATLR